MTSFTSPASRKQLLALIAQLQEQGESERLALARLLHDELGGLLAATRMELSNLQATPSASASAALAHALRVAEQQLVQALAIERRAVERLRPGLLDHFGLAAALKARYEQDCSELKLELRQALPAEPLPLKPAAAIALYRVGEAVLGRVANCGASWVELSLQRGRGSCTLRISHDGHDVDSHGATGFVGLQLLLSRLGGKLSVTRADDTGLTVAARVPLDAPRL